MVKTKATISWLYFLFFTIGIWRGWCLCWFYNARGLFVGGRILDNDSYGICYWIYFAPNSLCAIENRFLKWILHIPKKKIPLKNATLVSWF